MTAVADLERKAEAAVDTLLEHHGVSFRREFRDLLVLAWLAGRMDGLDYMASVASNKAPA